MSGKPWGGSELRRASSRSKSRDVNTIRQSLALMVRGDGVQKTTEVCACFGVGSETAFLGEALSFDRLERGAQRGGALLEGVRLVLREVRHEDALHSLAPKL